VGWEPEGEMVGRKGRQWRECLGVERWSEWLVDGKKDYGGGFSWMVWMDI